MKGLWGLLQPSAELYRGVRERLGLAEEALESRPIFGAPGDRGWSACRGPLTVWLTGMPRWRDPSLARLARDDTPAAALCAAWEQEGIQALHGIEQGYALAVFDGEDLLLAVDPLGLESLAYAEAQPGLLWASRSDFIATLLKCEINPQGVFNYVHAHMVPSPDTIWTGVRKLTPGSLLRFRKGRVQCETWWSPAWREPVTRPDFTASAERLRHLLTEAVKGCLGTAPAAAFLSGGLDSSSVVSLASRLRPKAVTAFGIGFHAEGYDEMAFAEASAAHAGAKLKQYYLSPDDVLTALPLVAAAYDEPFGNASALPTYVCAREAASLGFPLLLAGDGGDELFGGNARYARQLWFEPYQRLPGFAQRWLNKGPLAGPLGRLPGLTKLASYVRQASIPLPDRLESWNFLHRQALAEIFTPEFLAGIDPDAPLAAQRERYHAPRDTSTLKRMLHLDLKFTLADNDLRKVNRMAELAGIEVRYPMLDLALIDFAAGLPSDWLVRRGELRWFYRRAFEGVLSPITLGKRKHGFGLPFGVWMQAHAGLRELAITRLAALQQRGWFQAPWLNQLMHKHAAGHADYYGVMIWVLCLLEEWLQRQGR